MNRTQTVSATAMQQQAQTQADCMAKLALQVQSLELRMERAEALIRCLTAVVRSENTWRRQLKAALSAVLREEQQEAFEVEKAFRRGVEFVHSASINRMAHRILDLEKRARCVRPDVCADGKAHNWTKSRRDGQDDVLICTKCPAEQGM